MGSNRKTASTKGGKYMNPTDQARKEDRKKQLKKHKKQREQVREAVIKNKNPNTGKNNKVLRKSPLIRG